MMLAFIVLAGTTAFSQLPSRNFGVNADNSAVGRNPRLDFAFQEIRNKKPFDNGFRVTGSAYFHEDFRKASIYSSDGLEGILYVRYNGYADLIQIRPRSENEEAQMLLPRKDIYCVLEATRISFERYYDKKGDYTEGYLFTLFELDDMTLYEKRAKLFKEGKEGVTSLELDVPNRYVESRELYVGRTDDGKERIHFLKSTKKEILKLFESEPDATKKLKRFITDKGLKLKDSKEVIRVFRYYESL